MRRAAIRPSAAPGARRRQPRRRRCGRRCTRRRSWRSAAAAPAPGPPRARRSMPAAASTQQLRAPPPWSATLPGTRTCAKSALPILWWQTLVGGVLRSCLGGREGGWPAQDLGWMGLCVQESIQGGPPGPAEGQGLVSALLPRRRTTTLRSGEANGRNGARQPPCSIVDMLSGSVPQRCANDSSAGLDLQYPCATYMLALCAASPVSCCLYVSAVCTKVTLGLIYFLSEARLRRAAPTSGRELRRGDGCGLRCCASFCGFPSDRASRGRAGAAAAGRGLGGGLTFGACSRHGTTI